MTPATPVLHFLAKRQLKNNILVLQLENEIAVVNAALGASFGGAKVMIGTSGGGFALMTEALSLAGMSEMPLVVYLSQRTAPSTGVPTYTGQSDLKFALNCGHGEFPKIVVAPGDPQETIARTQEAFYLTAKYRNLAIVIGDKHLGESNYTFDKIENLYRTKKRTLEERYSAWNLEYIAHLSHWYLWGAMVYDRFIIREPPREAEEALALHNEIWNLAVRTSIKCGGVLSEHHGVGLKLARLMREQYGPAFQVMEGLKKSMDPYNILNPGKIFDLES